MVKAYVMRTGVIIDGNQYFYDLYRVRHIDELEAGDELLTISPVTDKLCRVRVEGFTNTAVKVQEIRESPMAIFWKISFRDVNRRVYKINYSPREIPQ